MHDLSNNIYEYYCSHFEALPFDKQLHFASRLYLWSGDTFGKKQLARLRPGVTAHDNPSASLEAVYAQALQTVHHGSKNAAALRAPYFEKYPKLRPAAMLLFRLTFLKTIYDLDARETLFTLMPKEELDNLMSSLLADEAALAVLSTHAINVLYLYHRVVLEDEEAFDPALFLEIGRKAYDLSDPIHLQLYIYLYTHCIIGESHFYARPIDERHAAVYQQMLDELEICIDEHFERINLDNKFEYLVCCKLLGKESKLTERIEAEAAQSVSADGTYLVDRHNTNPQTTNSTLDLSEHRNVLYIMSHRVPRLGR